MHCSELPPTLFEKKPHKVKLFSFQPCLAYKISSLLDNFFSGKDHPEHQYLYKTFLKLVMKGDLELQQAVVL